MRHEVTSDGCDCRVDITFCTCWFAPLFGSSRRSRVRGRGDSGVADRRQPMSDSNDHGRRYCGRWRRACRWSRAADGWRRQVLSPAERPAAARARGRAACPAGRSARRQRQRTARAVRAVPDSRRCRHGRRVRRAARRHARRDGPGRERTCRRATRIATVAVDTPFFPRDLVARLAAAARRRAASRPRRAEDACTRPSRFCRSGWRTILPRSSRPARRVGSTDWLARQEVARVDFGEADGVDPFFNINTPDDLARGGGVCRGGLRRPARLGGKMRRTGPSTRSAGDDFYGESEHALA